MARAAAEAGAEPAAAWVPVAMAACEFSTYSGKLEVFPCGSQKLLEPPSVRYEFP